MTRRSPLVTLLLLLCPTLAGADCPAALGRWPYLPVQAVTVAHGPGDGFPYTFLLAGSGNTLLVMNTFDPLAPTVTGSLALAGTITKIAANDVGSVAYVATGQTGLRIVDLRDQAHPAEIGHVDAQAYGVAFSNGKVYVGDSDLRIYDASTFGTLTQIGPSTPVWNCGAALVSLSGNLAVVGGSCDPFAWSYNIVDVSNPSQPVPLSGDFRMDELLLTSLSDLAVSGNLLVLSGYRLYPQSDLAVLDVSNPAAPVQLGTSSDGGGPLAMLGGLVLVGAYNAATAVSIADPRHPTTISSLTTPAYVAAFAPANPIYAADNQGGLLMLDTSACGSDACSVSCTPEVPALVFSGAAVQFQGAYLQAGCSGQPTFDWDFGDGTPHSSEQNPSHAYATAGAFPWSLKITLGSASCTTSDTIHVFSNLPPITSPGAFAYLVPTSAHKPGYNGTHWVTDLVLTNPGLADTVARVYFMKGGQDNTGVTARPVIVPLRQSAKLVDVIGATFSESNASGALLIGSDVPLIVTSRTYNDTAAGTYGQYVEGEPLGAAIQTGQSAWLVQLAQSASLATGSRTNVGLVNVTADDISLDVALYTGDGTWVGTKYVSLPPFGFQQVDLIYTGFAPNGVDNGYALVSVSAGSGSGAKFFAYASVIDNQSGDPITIPATLSPAGP